MNATSKICGFLFFATLAAHGGEIVQHFPSNQPASEAETQWRIVWGTESHAGNSEVLCIREAWFKRSASEPEIQVLDDCRLAEIFVPYNDGNTIYDISQYHFSLDDIASADLGPPCLRVPVRYGRNGIEVSEQLPGVMAHEVHDDLIRWRKVYDGAETRRGQIMLLWSVLSAGNYRYIMLYTFSDDGTVGFKLGATAHNLNDGKSDDYAHEHTAFWRLNVSLGNAEDNTVSLVEWEPKANGGGNTLAPKLIDSERNGGITWNLARWPRLRIQSSTVNNGHRPPSPIAYELHPHLRGQGVHSGEGEEFSRHDVWITRRKTTEKRPVDIPSMMDGDTLQGAATTLWVKSSLMHAPRDEDFGPVDYNAGEGVAITAWSGIELKPKNFFNSTPLYKR